MDNSEAYINMCEKAKEIQFAHSIYELGAFYLHGRSIIDNLPEFSIATNINAGKKRVLLDLKVWLPRQDQLQALIGNYNEQCNAMYKYIVTEVILPSQVINSMEQLWLKIVMKEKYNKAWVVDDWVIEK